MYVTSELVPDLLSLCDSSLVHMDQNFSLCSCDLCKGHDTRMGRNSPISQHLLWADQVESSPSSDTTRLGPSEDAHLIMGIFISGSTTSTLFQNSLAMVLPLYSHTVTNTTFPRDVSILPSHRSPNVVTHMTELCLLNSTAAVNIHRLLEEKHYCYFQ